MTYKLGILSDFHLGYKNNSENYLTIMENYFLKTLPSILKENKISDVRLLGDIFDNRNTINVRTLNIALNIFRWYQTNLPHVKWSIVVGNHDIYYHNRLDVNSLEVFRELNNINIIDKLTIEKIGNKSIVSVPWIIDGAEADIKFKELTNGTNIYDLCLGHFDIQGCEMQRGHVSEHGIPKGTFKSFKKLFSGHFHIRNTGKDDKITFCGCPYQLTWGDYDNTKGFHIYDIDTNETTFIENTDSPQFIKITVEDFISKNVEKIKKVTGNFVKLIIEKQIKESDTIKLIQRIESLKPLKLDIENNTLISLAESEEATKLVEKYKDTNLMSGDSNLFMTDYVENILEVNDKDIKKEYLISILNDFYQKVIKEK
jgi:DNA repair exonuclease SbcCD nuclease subunit